MTTMNELWISLVIIFLIIEIVRANGYTLWISACAALVAFSSTRFAHTTPLYQFLIFLVLSLLCSGMWFRVLRRAPLPGHFPRPKQYIGHLYTLEKTMKHGKGKIEIDQRVWFTHSDAELPKGTPVRVKGVNGAVLLIEKA